jgi:hypothetical protein
MSNDQNQRPSRRFLLRAVPTAAVGIAVVTMGASAGIAQDLAVTPPPDPDIRTAKKYMLMFTSLIPGAPKNKRSAIVEASPGERVSVRQYLGLPIQVEVEPDATDGYASISILDEHGVQLAEIGVANRTAATFVDQRIQVHFSVFED